MSATAGACLVADGAFVSTGAAGFGRYAVICTVGAGISLRAGARRFDSLETAMVTVDFGGSRVKVRGAPGVALLNEVFLALRRTHSR